MTIRVCLVKCGNCKTFLLRDADVGGDYVKGILHSWCPICGVMYGPESRCYVIKPISKRKARKVAIKIATKHKLNFSEVCQIASKTSPNGVEEFVIRFTQSLNNNDITEEEVLNAML